MGKDIQAKIREIRPRIVITGLGAITPLGNSVQETWEGLVAGRSGVGPITTFDASEYPSRVVGAVKGFDATEYIPFKEARRMARSSHMAIATATQAIKDAGFSDGWPDEDGNPAVQD